MDCGHQMPASSRALELTPGSPRAGLAGLARGSSGHHAHSRTAPPIYTHRLIQRAPANRGWQHVCFAVTICPSQPLSLSLASLGPMKQATLILTTLTLVIGTLLLCSQSRGFFSGLFFVPTSLGPVFVTLLMAVFLSSRRAQIALFVSSVLYCGWFAYAYADIFYIHLDPQSSIALLFIGAVSLPVMAVFWLAAGVLQATSPRPNNALQRTEAGGGAGSEFRP